MKDIAKANIKDLNAKTPKWYVPLINNSSNDPDAHAARQRRVKLLTTIVQIVSLNIVVDILTGLEDQKTALKNFESYIPKEIWSNNAEKVIGLSNLKKSTTNVAKLRVLHSGVHLCTKRGVLL